MQPFPLWFRLIAAAFYFTWSAVAIVGSVVAWMHGPSSVSVSLTIASYACLVLVIVVGGPLTIVVDRHLRRSVIAADLRPCSCCGHSLSGLDRYARCPECGTAHDTEKLRDFWSRCLHLPRRRTTAELVWMFGGGAVAFALLVAFGFLLTALGASDFGKPMIPLAIVLPALLVAPLRTCLRRRLIQARFKLCRRCGKRLDGSRSQGKCPLCTLPYAMTDVQQQWHDDFPVDWNRDVLVTCKRAERYLC
jgi:hypothetical protein